MDQLKEMKLSMFFICIFMCLINKSIKRSQLCSTYCLKQIEIKINQGERNRIDFTEMWKALDHIDCMQLLWRKKLINGEVYMTMYLYDLQWLVGKVIANKWDNEPVSTKSPIICDLLCRHKAYYQFKGGLCRVVIVKTL